MKLRPDQIVTYSLYTIIFFVVLIRSHNIGAALSITGFVALFGFAATSSAKSKYNSTKKKKYAFLAEETLFNNAIMVLIAAVIKADAKTSDKELRYTETALKLHFKEKKVQRQIAYIKHLVTQDKIYVYEVCRIVNLNFRFNEKIQLMHFLIGIVTSDGLLTKAELNALAKISQRLKIPYTSLKAIMRMFNFIDEEEVENRKKRQREKKTVNVSFGISRAFEILGIPETASVKEIKKAYRKLAFKHHPDRLIQLGEEHQKSAKEKFLAISDAYELIKESKGFS